MSSLNLFKISSILVGLIVLLLCACENNNNSGPPTGFVDTNTTTDTQQGTDSSSGTETQDSNIDSSDSTTSNTDPVDTQSDSQTDTETEPESTDTQTSTDEVVSNPASMTGTVDRGGGLYALEFADDSNTWYFACKAEEGGRITHFSLNGKNFLLPSTVNGSNYGSIFWTSPQDHWNWPPPHAINDATWSVSVDEDNYKITLSQSGISFGGMTVGVTKTFSVDLDKKAVVLEYSITNEGSAAIDIAPWEVTRVHPGGITFFRMGSGSISSGTFGMYPNENIDGVIWCDHLAITQAGDYKLFADGQGGWLAHADAETVFVKTFEDIPLAQAAPNEAQIELYGNLSYEEVEQQGAYREIAPGGTYAWEPVYWYLRDMPDEASFQVGNGPLLSFVEELIL